MGGGGKRKTREHGIEATRRSPLPMAERMRSTQPDQPTEARDKATSEPAPPPAFEFALSAFKCADCEAEFARVYPSAWCMDCGGRLIARSGKQRAQTDADRSPSSVAGPFSSFDWRWFVGVAVVVAGLGLIGFVVALGGGGNESVTQGGSTASSDKSYGHGIKLSTTCERYLRKDRDDRHDAVVRMSADFKVQSPGNPFWGPNMDSYCGGHPNMSLGDYFERAGPR